MRISRQELAKKIKATDKFYSVDFIKRSNRELRRMNCRNGVKKHRTGGELNYNPEDHDLIVTYSIDSEGYRTIPVENLVGACIEGQTYLVK